MVSSRWRKLHIGVDDDGYVVAAALTQHTVDDADMLPDLLGQVDAPLRRFTCDGGTNGSSAVVSVRRGSRRSSAKRSWGAPC